MATVEREDRRDVIRATIQANSRADGVYVTMNVLATLIACYGLLEDSPAVVIGAMLVAMLLGPISGIALGLVDGNNQLVRTALRSLAIGVIVVYGTAFAFGRAHNMFPLTAEIYARTAPNLMDLMIALAAGAAGAYAMTSPQLNVALVGVAVATALVPPLSSSAICLARGEYRLAAGALLLAFANMVGIQMASSIVMWLRGYHGQGPYRGVGRLLQRSIVKHSAKKIRNQNEPTHALSLLGNALRGARDGVRPMVGFARGVALRRTCPVPNGPGTSYFPVISGPRYFSIHSRLRR